MAINVIKKLNEENQTRAKKRKNTSEEQTLINKAHDFVNTYIMPKINIYDLIGTTNKKEEIIYSQNMTSSAVDMTILFAQVNEENKAPNMLKDEEIGFLDKGDVKLKKDIANRIRESVIKQFTYNTKVNDYIDKYIVPMLEELNKDKIIIYDTESKEKETSLMTNNTMQLVKKYIYNETKESIGFSIFKYLYDEEYTNDWNFLFNDNENAKNEFVGIVKDFLINNYKKIDVKDIDKFDIEQYLKASTK